MDLIQCIQKISTEFKFRFEELYSILIYDIDKINNCILTKQSNRNFSNSYSIRFVPIFPSASPKNTQTHPTQDRKSVV